MRQVSAALPMYRSVCPRVELCFPHGWQPRRMPDSRPRAKVAAGTSWGASLSPPPPREAYSCPLPWHHKQAQLRHAPVLPSAPNAVTAAAAAAAALPSPSAPSPSAMACPNSRPTPLAPRTTAAVRRAMPSNSADTLSLATERAAASWARMLPFSPAAASRSARRRRIVASWDLAWRRQGPQPHAHGKGGHERAGARECDGEGVRNQR
jgi:hypothetical protein